MNDILENIKMLAPYLIISWSLLIISTIRKPQRYFNSILLMFASFFTMFFICGLFGNYMGYALLVAFILVMAAIFVVPLMLIINGIEMIKKESFALAHILSLLLGIGIGIGELATIFSFLSYANFEFFKHINKPMYILGMTVFYLSCLVLSFVLYCIFIQLLPYRANFDYVIIHGCGLAGGERVTKLLAGRIDKAIEVYNRCKEKPVIIPSGGRGRDEKLSEAQAMTNYLLEHGIPEDHIILEDRSATTKENLINSKEIIDSRGDGKRIAIISSNYHVYRCLKLAKTVGLKCVGLGGKVALYFWPSAIIREFVAIAKNWKFILFSALGYIFFMMPMSVGLLYM